MYFKDVNLTGAINSLVTDILSSAFVILTSSYQIHDCSYVVKLTPDGSYGVKENNGSWNGMIGMLTRKVIIKASYSELCNRQHILDTCY